MERAKRLAKKRKTSVSRLVEDYLKKIPEEEPEASLVSFFVKNAPKKKTKAGTEKETITTYLTKKQSY